MTTSKPDPIDAYCAQFPADVQKKLRQMQELIRKTAPDAEEVISYGMPGYRLGGMLVWFAAHTTHIGFYPTASGIAAFKRELAVYKSAKGSVQFPFDQALPVALIKKIVQFRVKENRAKLAAKKRK